MWGCIARGGSNTNALPCLLGFASPRQQAQHLHQPAAHCNHAPQGETEAIGKLLEKTQLQKYGPAELNQRFMIMDTICDATQARGCTALHFVLAGLS